MSQPEYTAPPLEEVVFGVHFEPLKNFTAAYHGLFWSQIRENYPSCEAKPPLMHEKELPEPIPNTSPRPQVFQIPVVPRSWFITGDSTQLIQLQRDLFIRNWRRVDGGEVYPRFKVLVESFKADWNRFLAFAQQENLGEAKVDQCELTYINHIDRGAGWQNFADLGGVFSFIRPISRSGLLADPETFSWSSDFKLPDGRGRLHVEMNPVFRGRDFKMVLAFSLRARGEPAGGSNDQILSWFDLAHDWVVKAFDDLTEPTMHSLWKKRP